MDIEINNTFLKNGIQILVPPDLGDLSLDIRPPYEFMHQTTLKDYEMFYTKRSCLLKSVIPVVLYALDEIGPSQIVSHESEKEISKNVEYLVGECSKFYVDKKTENKEVDSVTESVESLGITFEPKIRMDNECEDYVKNVEEALKFHYENKNSQLADLSEEVRTFPINYQ